MAVSSYPQSGEIWRFVAPELAKTHDVIIADLQGARLSEAARSGYDLSNVAEDIHPLVNAMGIATVKGRLRLGRIGRWDLCDALPRRDETARRRSNPPRLSGERTSALVWKPLWNFSEANPVFTFTPSCNWVPAARLAILRLPSLKGASRSISVKLHR